MEVAVPRSIELLSTGAYDRPPWGIGVRRPNHEAYVMAGQLSMEFARGASDRPNHKAWDLNYVPRGAYYGPRFILFRSAEP